MDLGIDGLGEAQRIGAGASATVYRAHQPRLGREVAVKVLHSDDPNFVRRFEREAITMGRLGSRPGITTVFDSGVTSNGLPYLLLELCPSSLLDLIESQGRVDPVQACALMADVSGALADAHEMGVVHRDIKPGNILLTGAGKPLVTDFGISTVVGATYGQTSSIGFSPGYAAPETLEGRPAGQQSDVYALGATLFHLVTGRAPFVDSVESGNLVALALRVTTEPVPDLRATGVPDEVCSIIERAMAKQPEHRPEARELQQLLQQTVGTTGLSTPLAAGAATRAPIDNRTNSNPTVSALAPSPQASALLSEPGLQEDPAKTITVGKKSMGWLVAGIVVVLAVVGGALLFTDDGAPEAGFSTVPRSEDDTTESDASNDVPAAPSGTADNEGEIGNSDTTTSSVDPAATPGAGITVRTRRSQRSVDWFQAAIFEALLIELGYEVQGLDDDGLASADAYSDMMDDDLDYWPQSLFPLDDQALASLYGTTEEAVLELIPTGDLMPAGYVDGFAVSSVTAQARGITSLGQINDDPELVALFDDDGNGKAEIVGCEPSLPCKTLIAQMLEANGWNNLEEGSTFGYLSEVTSAGSKARTGDPVLAYVVLPSAFAHSMQPGTHVTWLSVGPSELLTNGSSDYQSFGPAPLGSDCTDRPCHVAFGWSDVQLTARADFLDSNPAAAVLFRQVELDPGDVSKADPGVFGGSSVVQARQKAQSWISDNRPLVDQWLAAAQNAS